MDGQQGAAIGVVGGCGGVGASLFAAVLAATAAAATGRCLLVDLDPSGGGLDVLLGAEAVPGPRWSQLRLAGGVLDAELLLAGLPAWGRSALLCCDRSGLPPPDRVAEVLDAGGTAAPVVVGLAREPSDQRTVAVACCAVVALVCAVDLPAIIAARSVLDGLDPQRVMLVGRGGRSASARAAELLGLPLAARLPARRGRDAAPLRPDALPSSMRRVARGLLAPLLAARPGPAESAGVAEVFAAGEPGWLP